MLITTGTLVDNKETRKQGQWSIQNIKEVIGHNNMSQLRDFEDEQRLNVLERPSLMKFF